MAVAKCAGFKSFSNGWVLSPPQSIEYRTGRYIIETARDVVADYDLLAMTHNDFTTKTHHLILEWL